MSKYLVVIVGPTAVGKTAVSLQLAKHFNTAVVSADSRQFFRELNIGTAKPTLEELKEVRHYLVNSRSIHEEYNASLFEHDALAALQEIYSMHDVAILCGGSGMYVDMLCKGADSMPAKDDALRQELENKSIEELQQQLQQLDPEYYQKIDKQNRRRLLRAVEVCLLSGKKYSELRTGQAVRRPFIPIKVGIEDDRELVYKRINERVDKMVVDGLVEEARQFHRFKNLTSLRTHGYEELFDYFDGTVTLEQAIDKIKQDTRNYAKRQWTWFLRDKEMRWFKPSEEDLLIAYVYSKLQYQD